jgi:UPF0755 protein
VTGELGSNRPQQNTIAWRGLEARIFLGIVICLVLWVIFLLLPYGPAHEIIVSINPGMSSREIAKLLTDAELVQSPALFQLVTKLTRVDNKLKAGTYRLSSGMGTVGIVRALAQGKVELIRFTIPEGVSTGEIADILEAKGLASKERFLYLATGRDHDFKVVEGDMEFSGNLEGYLFPNTYAVESGTSEEAIIAVMVKGFAQAVLPEWSQNDVDEKARELGLHGVITLASIIEKEAKLSEDRPLVASVFYNRLKLGMPLQSCATVQFALGSWKARLSLDDLKTDSPYNTYIASGLPPGPIASPGLSSVHAALRPATSDYLFFAADQKGGHVFSRTFREHQKAIAQVQVHD